MRNKMLNLRITQLTPEMTVAVQQAAAILHHVFALQGSWETLEGAIQEVEEMLALDRMVWVAMVDAEVIGWIGGIPQHHGNVWGLHPLVVKPEWQRQGVGSRLVEHLEQQVKARVASPSGWVPTTSTTKRRWRVLISIPICGSRSAPSAI